MTELEKRVESLERLVAELEGFLDQDRGFAHYRAMQEYAKSLTPEERRMLFGPQPVRRGED